MIFFIFTTVLFCALVTVFAVGPSNLRKEGLRGFLFTMFMVFGVCASYFGMGRMEGEHRAWKAFLWMVAHQDELEERMPTMASAARAKKIPVEVENIADGNKYLK